MKKKILTGILAALCLFFKAAAQDTHHPPAGTLRGTVTDEKGSPLAGAIIRIAKDSLISHTGNDGMFAVAVRHSKGTLTISYTGYQRQSAAYDLAQKEPLLVVLKANENALNAVQIIGYGQTTRRLNTGSVATVGARTIEEQPVTNVLSALSGRAAGVFVQTTNGLPGGGISIRIRGQNSLRNTPGNNGNLPLYVIDGVPYSSGPLYLDAGGAATATVGGAISPLNSLNPADVESISILKDADATAIYGSRGANGVVLITTKKGKAGDTKVSVNYTQGVSRAANYPQLLDLDQYLAIRREAFRNDGITPSSDPSAYPGYAPDLTLWSQTQGTDWARFILGHASATTDVQGSISGGSELSQFFISSNYRSEGSILLGGGHYQRAGLHINLSHASASKKFTAQFSASYTGDRNRLPNAYGGLMAEVLTAPNFPLRNGDGSLDWSNNINPLADVKAQSNAQTNNFIADMMLGYRLAEGLDLKTSLGYNRLDLNQVLTNPLSAQNPSYGVSSANYGTGYNQSFILEPQLTYAKTVGKSNISALLGGTYQNTSSANQYISASNFSNDGLLENAASAGMISATNYSTNYKYVSVFARITYNLDQKYLVNVSGRRDGSSRFGPGDRFGNFGSVGAAWIFSNEAFVKNKLSFLSFGKLRASYGLTGNDQIKDYQYLSTYSSSGNIYQGTSGLQATQIANADLHWETNKKAEIGLELGFLNDRISLAASYFRNRSSNQLISYTLPAITGFTSYQANLPAVVQNTGWELELNTTNIASGSFTWKTSFNFTLPQNKLISFPGLAASSYANTLTIGKDISQAIGYRFTGVNPATGAAQYDIPIGQSSPSYFNQWGQTSPYFYGGIGTTLIYKSWQLDIFGQFAKQYAHGGLYYTPGLTLQNDFQEALQRWQKPGDITSVPRASTSYDPYYSYSSANWFNASYFRLKNVAFSYTVPQGWLKSKKIERLKFYVQGQNLLTIWKNHGALYDPETGGDNTTGMIPIPPLRSLVAGIQLTF